MCKCVPVLLVAPTQASSVPPQPLPMTDFSACLLLLACATVQVVLVFWSRRAALAVVVLTGVVQATWAHSAQLPATESIPLLAAFLMACAAMDWAHRRAGTRHDALVALCDVDEATRCLNRRGFASRLERAADVALGSGAPLALLALDLDHFKLVNDRFGHLAGDAVLAELSAALMHAVGDRGIVARLGGEEFAVLLGDTDAEGAGVMAERLLATCRGLRLHALPSSVRLTMSIGIAAERIHDAGTTDSLRARADEALYAGKRSGRDRALLWAPGVHSHATPVRSMMAVGSGLAAPRSMHR